MTPDITLKALQDMASRYPLDGSVHRLELNGKRYWLKTQGDEKDNAIRRLSVWLARFGALQFFSVNSVLGSAERLTLEIEHTLAMRAKNLPVPAIIYQGEGLFITPDCGTTLRDDAVLSTLDANIARQAFKTLAQFHQKDCYHGRPALRDIALNSAGQLTFLDMEESGVQRKPKLMARDVFLLLTDFKRAPQLTKGDKLACVELWADQVPADLPGELHTIYRFVKRLSFLPRLVLRFRYNSTSEKILDTLSVLDAYYELPAQTTPNQQV